MVALANAFASGVAGGAGSYVGVKYVGPALEATVQKIVAVAPDYIEISIFSVGGAIFIGGVGISLMNPLAGMVIIASTPYVMIRTESWLMDKRKARNIVRDFEKEDNDSAIPADPQKSKVEDVVNNSVANSALKPSKLSVISDEFSVQSSEMTGGGADNALQDAK